MKTIQDYPTINERPPEGLKSDGTAFKVLVVDDSMFVAKQLGQILASEGYDVVATAVDGAEGVAKYKELCPHVDLVTMDITMPKMDGITALEQIMAFDKNAKVVMVSALGKEHYRRIAHRYPGNNHRGYSLGGYELFWHHVCTTIYQPYLHAV